MAGFSDGTAPLPSHLVWMAPGGGVVEVEVDTGTHSGGLAQDCWSHRLGVVGDNRKDPVHDLHADRATVGSSFRITL